MGAKMVRKPLRATDCRKDRQQISVSVMRC
jgi:hypothetical protein